MLKIARLPLILVSIVAMLVLATTPAFAAKGPTPDSFTTPPGGGSQTYITDSGRFNDSFGAKMADWSFTGSVVYNGTWVYGDNNDGNNGNGSWNVSPILGWAYDTVETTSACFILDITNSVCNGWRYTIAVHIVSQFNPTEDYSCAVQIDVDAGAHKQRSSGCTKNT
jgi:hypothetical protein